jgi:fatty acid desaturase
MSGANSVVPGNLYPETAETDASRFGSKAATSGHGNGYPELSRLIKQSGLFHKQPGYYAFKILLNLFLLAIGVALVVTLNANWLRLAFAVYLAFVSAQISFIVHDAGHQQICHSRWKNDFICLIHSNLLLGFSYSWWVDSHNRHHGRPNQYEHDPDINFAVLAFSEEQAREKTGLSRFIVKHQAYFFFPLLFLEAFNLRVETFRYLFRNKAKHPVAEAVCIGLHLLLYGGTLWYCMGLWGALAFAIIHQGFFGFYLGMVFITNHEGMPMLEKNAEIDFLRHQVITARNLRRHRLTDYCFGGLSCQIEHHLFPSLPVNKLREAQRTVRSFCASHSVSYLETGLLESYREILRHLHQVGAPLRESMQSDCAGPTAAH